jgi:nicotinamidase-related amidase
MKNNKFTENQVLKMAREAYENGDVDFEIISNKCALIVIDMQNEFVKPNWSPYWVPEATRQVPLIKKLINHCRKLNIPVIYTIYSKTHNFLDRPKFLPIMPCRFPNLNIDQSNFFINGEVWHEIKPFDKDIIIKKPSYGAFYDTPLETILKNMDQDTLIICGTLTNYCCSTTARQAFERSFKVIFGKDVTSSHFIELHEAEIKILRRGFAKILSSKEIIKKLKSYDSY